MRRFCAFIARHVVSRPGLYSAFGLLLVAALSFNYSRIQPRYQLADQVPQNEQAITAICLLDAELTGANPIEVLIEFPPNASLYETQTLNVIAAVHSIVAAQPDIGNVWSLETLREWLAKKGA